MPESTLSPDRWHQVQQLFHAALEQPESRRDEYLRTRCGDDSELRGAVASLLAAHARSLIGDSPMKALDVRDTIAAALADRYEIERPLGSGGMATVFVALDLKHRRKVAIKVMRPELTLGVERFLREIEIAAGLQHPHILPLFDSGAADGLLYYVMPYVDGPTLATRMQREGALPFDDALQIATDVLGALDYAHRKGVVHRDIKPSNILLSTSTGHALIADFGIARAISTAESDDLTTPGVAIGTPGYMPPEQARGETVTAATDIYATGLVLHECFTGRQYSGETTGRANWSGVPPAIREALRKALRQDPDDRWKAAGDFRRALVSGRPGARWRSRIGLSAAAVVLLGSFGAWWVLGRESEPVVAGTTRLAVLPFTVSGGSELDYLGEGMVDLLSTKLDGAGSWRTVDPRVVLSRVNRVDIPELIDPTVGRRIARQLGASSYVLGNIVEVGDRIRLDASLYGVGANDDRAATASAEGSPSDVLELLDEMAAELISVQQGVGNARLTQIAAVTSQSLPALKSYLRGVRSLRLGEFPVAAAAFQSAIALDSSFALAWYQLSITADWMLRSDMALEAADQAVRHADRLSERDRRLLEALRTIRLGDLTEAERQYRAILGSYPDDVEAWSQLGELLFHFGPHNARPVEDSREAWNRLIELEPDQATAYIHLARVAASRGDLTRLDQLTERALELAPEGDRGLEMRMFRAYLRNEAGARARIMSDLRQAPEALIGEVVWSAGTFVQSPEAVMRVLSAATEANRSAELRALAYAALAFVEAGSGRWDGAWDAISQVARLDSVAALHQGGFLAVARGVIGDTTMLRAYHNRLLDASWSDLPPSSNRAIWFSASDDAQMYFRWYLLGLSAALLGEDDRAATYSDSLETASVLPGTGSTFPDQVRTLNAMRAHVTGSNARALDLLEGNEYDVWHQIAAASPFFNQGLERFVYAATLEEAGRLEDAVIWYGGVFDTSFHDRVFWAPAHLRLGHIHESLGELEVAREHYRQVTTLWVDADPAVQPLVDEARQGLQRTSP